MSGLLLFSAFPLRAGLVPIDSPTGPSSLAPNWTLLSDGRLVLSWLDRLEDGHAFRFSILEDGTFGKAGQIAEGEDWFANWADLPALVELPSGHWVAHWLAKSGSTMYAYDIVMAVSTDEGNTWSETFRPHDDGTQTEHGFVSYFTDGIDQAGVVWLDGRETRATSSGEGVHQHHVEGVMTLRSAVVDIRGRIVEAHLLDERVCDCCQTSAALTDQGPVVIYRDRSDYEVRDIHIVRRLDGQWTSPKVLYPDRWQTAACPVNGPALIAKDNHLIAAWFTMAQGIPRVQVALSSDSGANFGLVATLGSGQALGRADLAWWRDGFALVWLDQASGNATLRLGRFNLEGDLLWDREVTSVDDSRISGFPRLASPDGKRLMLSWTEADPDHISRVQVAEFSDNSD